MVKTSALMFFCLFMQSCSTFHSTSLYKEPIPRKTYMEVFESKAPEELPKINKSLLTPEVYELCMRNFINEHPTGSFDYYDARKDSKKKLYYFFFSYCFDGDVCYAYDTQKNKLVFKVSASTLPGMLSDEELLSQTNDLNNNYTE